MTNFEAFILGLIQGLTEFLPISSSGHLELGKAFFGLHPKNELLFTIIVHGATVLSTMVVFRKYLWQLITGFDIKLKNQQSAYLIKLFLSAIPIAIVGYFFEEEIGSTLFGNTALVGFMLIVTGLLLLLANNLKSTEKPVGYFHSLIIGMAQLIAILPGISRSGATISAALFLRISRQEAARFSFLMALAPIIAANVKTMTDERLLDQGYSLQPLLIGFVTAFISGYIACRWMLFIVKRGKLIHFAIYCFLIGLTALWFYYFG